MEKSSAFVNVGLILKMPKSELDNFFEALEGMENVKLVYKMVSWLPLWVHEKEPEVKQE
ncbi:hypothetical protein MUP05_03525 [Candidatus Bathyarchaeota archaeon]|nr:hypothetical protein [Candidatus Bathyarchaeota archaeon]